MRAEFFTDADRRYATITELQGALDGWVVHYNTERPHQSLGMRPPAERFALATAGPDPAVVDPVAAVAVHAYTHTATPCGDLRHAGVRRWVDQRGSIRLAGFGYRVPIVLAGEPVEAVVADNLVQIYHHDVLVASHAQRHAPGSTPRPPRQGRRTARATTSAIVVTRVVDSNGDVSFAGTMYRAGRPWRGAQVEVSIVAGPVQTACAGTIVRTHAIRDDRAKEHGAYPPGRPRKPRQDAPNGCRRQGHAATRSAQRPSLDPGPVTDAHHSDAGNNLDTTYRSPRKPPTGTHSVNRLPELDTLVFTVTSITAMIAFYCATDLHQTQTLAIEAVPGATSAWFAILYATGLLPTHWQRCPAGSATVA